MNLHIRIALILAAFAAPATAQVFTFTHQGLKDSSAQWVPRVVEVQVAKPSGATIQSVWVNVTETNPRGSMRFSERLHSFAPNIYTGILLGVEGGTSMEYRFQVVDGKQQFHHSKNKYSYKIAGNPLREYMFTIPWKVRVGASVEMILTAKANDPLLLLLSTKRGSLKLPGLPTIHVGQPWVAVSARVHANGEYRLRLPVPNIPSLRGTLFYMQSLLADSTGAVRSTNLTLGLIY